MQPDRPVDESSDEIDDISDALQVLHLDSERTGLASSAVAILAKASKYDESLRNKLADPVIFQNLLAIIDCNLNDSLETVDLALRCIGNACIDNDVAREHITDLGFSWAVRILALLASNEHATPALAAKVLCNICSDYEPAQQRCFQEHVHHGLMNLLSSKHTIESDDKILFIELLFWICSHKTADSTAQDPLPKDVLMDLLKLSDLYHAVLDPEDFAMLLETTLLFLRDTATQRSVVEHHEVNDVWLMLKHNEDKLSQLDAGGEDAKLLTPFSVSLTWCLSDMAAMPELAAKYILIEDWIRAEILHRILTADNTANARLLSAACQVLANMLWSLNKPETTSILVESGIHRPLLSILVQTQDAELLHSACGLLIQLSRHSPQVRERVGSDPQAKEALERLCKHETPQLKQDGIKLLRALGKECPAVQERFADLAKEVMLAPATTNGDSAMIEAPA